MDTPHRCVTHFTLHIEEGDNKVDYHIEEGDNKADYHF